MGSDGRQVGRPSPHPLQSEAAEVRVFPTRQAGLGILPGTVASSETTVIDISRVDWEAYCEAAVNWDRRYANGLD